MNYIVLYHTVLFEFFNCSGTPLVSYSVAPWHAQNASSVNDQMVPCGEPMQLRSTGADLRPV